MSSKNKPSRRLHGQPALLMLTAFGFWMPLRAEKEEPAPKVPPILDRHLGDLNGDGVPDRATMYQRREKGQDEMTRVLVVELGQKSGWKKILETEALTPAYPVDALGEEIMPPGAKIEENRLWIYDGITKSLCYKLQKDRLGLCSFSVVDYSRVSNWVDSYELDLEQGQANRTYWPPEDEEELTPPAWCPWAKDEEVNCNYPQVPIFYGKQVKSGQRLELRPARAGATTVAQMVASWATVEGRSIRIYFRGAANGATRFEPAVKNLKGEVLIPVSSEHRQDSSGTKVMLEFRPNHFGLYEAWRDHMETFSEQAFSTLELPCVLEVTVTPEQGTPYSLTSNPEKARHAAPFVLMPAFVLRMRMETSGK